MESKTREQVFIEKLKEILSLERNYRESNSLDSFRALADLGAFKKFIIDNSSDVAKGEMLDMLLQRQMNYFKVYSSNCFNDFYRSLAEIYKKDVFEVFSFLIRSIEQEHKAESEKENQ